MLHVHHDQSGVGAISRKLSLPCRSQFVWTSGRTIRSEDLQTHIFLVFLNSFWRFAFRHYFHFCFEFCFRFIGFPVMFSGVVIAICLSIIGFQKLKNRWVLRKFAEKSNKYNNKTHNPQVIKEKGKMIWKICCLYCSGLF